MGLLSRWNKIKAILQDDGTWFYQLWSSGTNFSKSNRLKLVLDNPAALFLFLLLSDLYSMGEYKLYKKGKEDDPIEDHPILNFLKNPNPMQTEEQFAWDYMFWRKLGCANLYIDSKALKGDGNIGYWLSPDKIKWPKWFDDNKETLFVSKAKQNELMDKEIEYKTQSQTFPFKYKNLKQFHDISNGLTGWFSSPSRVDALHKIIKNSDNSLNSKNINSDFASKFLVAGKHDAKNINTLPMSEGEKDDVERTMLSGRKNVHAMKSMVDIKRFIERADVLKHLDEAWLDDAMKIGQLLKIPQDVIGNLSKGSTYENQEMARASIVSYALEPDAQDFCKGILDFFGIRDHVLKYSFDHLPFVQAFEKSRSEVKMNLAKAFKDMVDGGADQQQSADFLGIDVDAFGPRNEGASNSSESKLSKVV